MRQKQKCRLCGQRPIDHVGDMQLCPDRSGRTYSRHRVRIAPSQSFSEVEVVVLDFIFRGLASGKDVAMAARHKAFGGLASKIMRMRIRAEELRTERDGPATKAPSLVPIIRPPLSMPEAGEKAGTGL